MINTRGISPGYYRVSINPQTDKTKFCMAWGMLFLRAFPAEGHFLQIKEKNACYARVLPYCTNRRTTVPMYADAFGLFVFGAFLTSGYFVKNLPGGVACVFAFAFWQLRIPVSVLRFPVAGQALLSAHLCS